MEAYVPKPENENPRRHADQLFDAYEVNTVPLSSISRWLKFGWDDLMANPKASLPYGLIFALGGILVNLIMYNDPVFVVAATAGFLLMGPFLATGEYDISRELESGRKISFVQSMKAVSKNSVSFGIYAIFLGLIIVFWVRIAAVITGLFFHNVDVQQESFWGMWQSMVDMPQGPLYAFIFLGVGFLFSAVVYVTGVVTPQLLLDRKVDIVTAASTSVRAVMKSPATFALWAVVISAITGLGLLTFDLGLIITMPWISHASWHLYREVVTTRKEIPKEPL